MVVALVLMTGLHWAALQTVAWTTMLADNLCGESFTTAVSQTFDGDHPCPLCKAIAAGKKAEKKCAAVSPNIKMEFPPLAEKFVLISPRPVLAFSRSSLSAESSFLEPSLPPPRGLFI